MAYRNLAQGLETRVVAFDGDLRIASGPAGEVALRVKRLLENGAPTGILIFDDETSRPVEIDFEGTDEDVLRFIDSWGRLPPSSKPATRDVTLLPRYWEWLDDQPGGASAVLRRLVDEARKSPRDAARRAQDSAYRFVLTMVGDQPGFEEATRALFANDAVRFEAETQAWPMDVRDRARELVRRTNAPD